MTSLWDPITLGNITLPHRLAMAPMTRSRAINNIPNDLMVSYYGSRADAGLIITEGVAPSPDGLGYARIPGLYNEAQAKAWKDVTDAVHANGGKIVVQLMHTGRIAHPFRLRCQSCVHRASDPVYANRGETRGKGQPVAVAIIGHYKVRIQAGPANRASPGCGRADRRIVARTAVVIRHE